ncbi:hypothetical protein PR048_016100 [Dryococelus australis]|uniref:Uncharacterized protein n=1 Tax=Dryococelus australis TaxID=614101 RepID=A0ABQ9HJZ2_9NEOP|nr:hypothetical protein PR048_016100 [Dryococelus australis]
MKNSKTNMSESDSDENTGTSAKRVQHMPEKKLKHKRGSTSGLVQHLKIHHTVETEYKKVNLINKDRESKVKVPEKKIDQQLTREESFAKKFKLDVGTVRAKAITN